MAWTAAATSGLRLQDSRESRLGGSIRGVGRERNASSYSLELPSRPSFARPFTRRFPAKGSRSATMTLPYVGPVMLLAAGTQLGSYEILSALGAGGMGEVSRA